jgi:hypothetical protein
MNKAHLALERLTSQDHRLSSIREIDWPVPEKSAISNLVQLYTEVENSLRETGGLLVQFVSVSAGHGNELVALDMAWAGATMLGRDILVLNATRSVGEVWDENTRVDGPAPGQAGRPLALETHLMKVMGRSLYVADLRDVCGNSRALAAVDEIVANLRKLAPMFDMIIIAAPSSDVDPFSTALARQVDGNIMVVEAERTRRSEAVNVRQILGRSGRPLLGAVLNNRRSHTPNWLSRWI